MWHPVKAQEPSTDWSAAQRDVFLQVVRKQKDTVPVTTDTTCLKITGAKAQNHHHMQCHGGQKQVMSLSIDFHICKMGLSVYSKLHQAYRVLLFKLKKEATTYL